MIIPKSVDNRRDRWTAVLVSVLVTILACSSLFFISPEMDSRVRRIDFTVVSFRPPEIEAPVEEPEPELDSPEPVEEEVIRRIVDASLVVPEDLRLELASNPLDVVQSVEDPGILRMAVDDARQSIQLDMPRDDSRLTFSGVSLSSDISGRVGSRIGLRRGGTSGPGSGLGRVATGGTGSGERVGRGGDVGDVQESVALIDFSMGSQTIEADNVCTWIRDHQAYLPAPVRRAMEEGDWDEGLVSTRQQFRIRDQEREVDIDMYLMCKESLLELHVILIEQNQGQEVAYLVDRNFQKQSNVFRAGTARFAGDEVVSLQTQTYAASDPRNRESYKVFLSWWANVQP